MLWNWKEVGTVTNKAETKPRLTISYLKIEA